MFAPKVGDYVGYTLEDGRSIGEVRPAMIVRTWGSEPTSAVQLVVFVDGTNDYPDLQAENVAGRLQVMPVIWKTSRQQAEVPTPGKWHRFAEED